MADKVIPTKGNLLAIKHSLKQARNGYQLIDRKRNVLIKEMVALNDKVRELRDSITTVYQQAYQKLQLANVSLGVISEIANTVAIEQSIKITYRSIMGVEIPNVSIEDVPLKFEYGFESTNSLLDETYIHFNQVKKLTVLLAEIDNSLYRLAYAIRKTQKRANALKNISIPTMETNIKYITDLLEEKEREEFTCLKIIKNKS